MPDDVFLASPRKAPAHRRSAAALRPPAAEDTGRFSLAHELAVALMPEPSAGSKLLAEEFGIEFDEGAEGIDDAPQIRVQHEGADFSFASEAQAADGADGQLDEDAFDAAPASLEFGSPVRSKRGQEREREREARPAQDPMDVLAQDLASTDNFLAHLRRLDTQSSSSSSTQGPPPQPALERLAADVIRRLNDTARDREGQVRELLECEREFRRIAGEVGGQDVLGQLEPLPEDEPASPAATAPAPAPAPMQDDAPASPTRPTRPAHLRALSQDWETDPDVDRLGDGEPETDPAYDAEPASPTLASSSSAFPSSTLALAALAALPPHLASLRALTSTLVGALTAVSEHAQVNGAATAEAGRRLRALRNRLGGWKAEAEGAERSRGRIERWEAGGGWGGEGGGALANGDGDANGEQTPATPTTPARGAKRVDGRVVVQEHLRAFERALDEAALKTKAIMAA
ncbi:hypothetical protein B0H17DRAFT_1274984 [Mycena rosella]|uniref:Uncharacterized protein n=1 Tax=Mycena rosella TaxID=1033263 RepID=A0AAD7DMH3_MYCRO|nr:hypothetical protein B0H17DRAFT_1274984 [Mycena rosella]